MARAERLDHLAGELVRLVVLVRIEDGVDARGHVTVDAELEHDGFLFLLRDVAVVRDPDVEQRDAPVGKRELLLDRVAAKGHRADSS